QGDPGREYQGAVGLRLGDVGPVLPAAARRLREVDERETHVARGDDLERLREQELPLRVEHFKVGGIAGTIAKAGVLERLLQLDASLVLRGERLARRVVRGERVVRVAK